MSKDKDDRVNRILRGNAGMEPKPTNVRRRNMLPSGVSVPSLALGGGIVTRPANYQRATPADMPNEPRVPIAPKTVPGEQLTYRRAGGPKPDQPAQSIEQPPVSKPKKPFKPFFERGDLSQEFNEIER